jgi:heat shock protein HslJ
MALPANAVFEATLEDVSRSDAPATILGRANLQNPGQPPFKFSIQYDPAQIQTGRSYSVRARVTAAGNLIFISDQAYPVLTRGAGNQVSILMIRASASAAPTQSRAEKSGMFRYMADAGLFMDCQTRERRPVAMEGAYKELEAAYLKLRQQPGEELMVTLEGQIMDRPGAEGGRPVPTLVINRYIGFWPGETCGGVGATSPLQETYWKLTRLQGKPVILKQNQKEPSLVFRKEGNRVTGYGGCNELTGTYTLKGNDLTFGGVAMTRRACIDGMDTEGIFAPALTGVRSWRILGEHLELYDASGTTVARFEARALK